MSDLPLLPEQPTPTDQVSRFGPLAIVTIIGLLFVLQNTRSATFNFLWFEFRWPLWIMLVVFMCIGAAISYGIGRRRRWRSAQADERE